MKAGIVTIGTEILIGQIIDTNSAFIAAELNKIGIDIYKIVSISDDKIEIFKVLDELIATADIVLLTGGLGPTSDDITKAALAEYFDTKLVLNEEALCNITGFLGRKNINVNELNHNQAFLPEKCKLIPNNSGTAMGMWFLKNQKSIISMPGVPFEMKEMMTGFIIPELSIMYPLPAIVHKTVLTTGIAESVMAELISEWENLLPQNIKLAYLPSPGVLRLRLSAIQSDVNNIDLQINQLIENLHHIIGNTIFGYDDDTIEGVVGKLLKSKKSTLAVTESCTGGYISHLVTSVPGSSAYFKGGITAYSNEIKLNILKVDELVLNNFGAVSEQVVIQMAEKVRKLMHSDYAIAVSGIAGPDGGTADKPVGTVWIAIASDNYPLATKFHFGDNRERNIRRASVAALNMLRLVVKRDKIFI